MATVIVGAALQGAGAGFFVTFVGTVAAAYVDGRYIMPGLIGDQRDQARPPRLLDVPVGSNEAGAPRVWAIGARVRVPTHILWQTQKVREETSGGGGLKGGTSVPLRRVFVDALVSLNDRPTEQLLQLRGNGALVLLTTRNLISVTTDQMSAAVNGGNTAIVVTMASTLDPDFTDYFAVGDIVRPLGFVPLTGATFFNNTYWDVAAVAAHAAGSPSSITLEPAEGQIVTGFTASGGSAFTPSSLSRIDDAVVEQGITWVQPTTSPSSDIHLTLPSDRMYRVFEAGSLVRLRNFRITSGGSGNISQSTVWRVQAFIGAVNTWTTVILRRQASGATPPIGSSGDVTPYGIIEYSAAQRFTSGLFPNGFDPDAHFYTGSETQGEDSLIAADKGTGNVPAYRGVSYQGLEQFYATRFGDQLPYSMEALIQPDADMTWQQAIVAICGRAGIAEQQVDVSGVTSQPFLGMYIRGSAPTNIALQPIVVAGQLLVQDRDGTLAFFPVENADVVAPIHSDGGATDFGCVTYGSTRDRDMWAVGDTAEEDLPTSIGLRHQDPDNQYADGYQHFGLRNPNGVEHQNEQEVDLSTLVLTRKQARGLAATLLRRAWINRRRYEFELPAAYLDILENDLVTWVNEEGDTVLCRVIQREIREDLTVNVKALAEEATAEVTGITVDRRIPEAPTITPPSVLTTIVIDAPAVEDSQTRVPGLSFAVCQTDGGWRGAQLWESVDGATYRLAGTLPGASSIATLDAELAADGASESYGTTAISMRNVTLDVTFQSLNGALEEATKAEAEAGKNWCAIVDADGTVEIAAFTTVAPNGSDNYTLGGWLRGLRGTTPGTHAEGAYLVLLTPGTHDDNVLHREFAGNITPKSLSYKVVPFGSSLDDVDAIDVTLENWNARPLPVRAVSTATTGSPWDITVTVDDRWCRTVLPLGTQPPHPLDEPYEDYLFTFYDPSGTTVERTKLLSAQEQDLVVLTARTVTYTAAEQTADGYTPGPTTAIWVGVQQVGQYGNGPMLKQILPASRIVLPLVTQAASGSLTYAGTSSQTLPIVTQAASGAIA